MTFRKGGDRSGKTSSCKKAANGDEHGDHGIIDPEETGCKGCPGGTVRPNASSRH